MAEDEKRLSPRVERALALARAAAQADRTKGTRGGKWLALLPIVVAVLLLALMMPRGTEPRDVPLPSIDGAALSKTTAIDKNRASKARSQRLPGDILAIGSALRAFNAVQSKGGTEAEVSVAAANLDEAKRLLGPREGAVEDLLTLRALQTEEFLAEVAKFESNGEASSDLTELAGNFPAHMRDAGWLDGKRVVLDEAQRRVAYKIVWNAVTALHSKEFDLSLDEERALYTLYLSRPHPPDTMRAAVEIELAQATTPETCKRAQQSATRTTELWRADKIQKLGLVDPTYPTAYALGVSFYRAGRYENSIEEFRRWVDTHPDGPYSLRAKNHLKAALAAYGSI